MTDSIPCRQLLELALQNKIFVGSAFHNSSSFQPNERSIICELMLEASEHQNFQVTPDLQILAKKLRTTKAKTIKWLRKLIRKNIISLVEDGTYKMLGLQTPEEVQAEFDQYHSDNPEPDPEELRHSLCKTPKGRSYFYDWILDELSRTAMDHPNEWATFNDKKIAKEVKLSRFAVRKHVKQMVTDGCILPMGGNHYKVWMTPEEYQASQKEGGES